MNTQQPLHHRAQAGRSAQVPALVQLVLGPVGPVGQYTRLPRTARYQQRAGAAVRLCRRPALLSFSTGFYRPPAAGAPAGGREPRRRPGHPLPAPRPLRLGRRAAIGPAAATPRPVSLPPSWRGAKGAAALASVRRRERATPRCACMGAPSAARIRSARRVSGSLGMCTAAAALALCQHGGAQVADQPRPSATPAEPPQPDPNSPRARSARLRL
jgi:hypothetical protein